METSGQECPTTLLCIVPAWRGKTADWTALLDLLAREPRLQGPDGALPRILRLDHHITTAKRGSLQRVCDRLRTQIDDAFEAKDARFERVILIGHSVGGLMVRRMYLDSLSERPPQRWALRTERIVLMAGMSRGYRVGFRGRSAEDPTLRRTKRIADLGCRIVLPADRFVSRIGFWRLAINDAIAGSDFVTSLRLAWMKTIPTLKNPPVVIQTLGSNDEFVEPSDSLDTEQFPGCGLVKVPEVDHAGIVRVSDPGSAQYRAIRRAVVEPPEPIGDAEGPKGKPVVFLLHGIHANKYGWVRALQEHLVKRHPEFEVRAKTFGPFTFLDFIRRGRRHAYAQWFLDQYTAARAANPGQPIHFVGHSFGTFVLGYALERFPDMAFDRVVLAGSVLPRSYDWVQRRREGQIGELRTHRGTKDVPVGILSRGLGAINRGEIGDGGYYGFNNLDPEMQDYQRVGGHGAAVDGPKDLEEIGDFLARGYKAESADESPDAPLLMRILNNASLVFMPALVIVGLLGPFVFWALGRHELALGVAAFTALAAIVAGALSS